MKRYLLLSIISATVVFSAYAQQEFTLHLMQTIPQSAYNNPAYVPTFNSYIGLPGISSIYTSEYNSGFSYNDVFTRREDDSLVVNLEALNNKLKSRNYFINQQEIDVLSFGFRLNPKMYLNFNLTGKNIEAFEYPNDIMALFVNGNSDFVGKTMNLSLSLDGMGYFETGVGMSYKVNDKLTVGARFKYLSGIINARTNQADFELFTDEFYALTISGDMQIETSGIDEMSNGDYAIGVKDISKYFKNSGFGLDIGGTYQINDKFRVGASISDIGFINWKNDVTSYTLEKEVSEFTWEGIDIQELITKSDALDNLLDSLENSFEIVEAHGGQYKTALPLRTYVTGRYLLPRNTEVGMVFFSEKYGKIWQTGIGLVGNKQFGKHFDFSLSYSFRKNTYNNLGAGFSLRLPPFQIYAVSDNLLGAPLYLNNIKYINLRMGINLVFNWNKKQAALPNSLTNLR